MDYMALKNKSVLIALGISYLLYGAERALPTVSANHSLDLNGDGRPDIITEEGYTFFPRYEVYIQGNDGKFVRDKSFSRKEITSKLKGN